MDLPVAILRHTAVSVVGATWRGLDVNPKSPYDGFSLCHYTGDDDMHVRDCRNALTAAFGIPAENIVVPRQIHGTGTAVITSAKFNAADIEGADAVVTTVPKLIVGVNTADCVPVVLADDSARIVAAVHAGWRGAVAGVVQNALDTMCSLGARQITAVIGAGICRDCFEVGPEVASQFPAEFVSSVPGARPHVDLPGYVANILHNYGITELTATGECTRCNPARYFSARALGTASGRNYTFAMLF